MAHRGGLRERDCTPLSHQNQASQGSFGDSSIIPRSTRYIKKERRERPCIRTGTLLKPCKREQASIMRF